MQLVVVEAKRRFLCHDDGIHQAETYSLVGELGLSYVCSSWSFRHFPQSFVFELYLEILYECDPHTCVLQVYDELNTHVDGIYCMYMYYLVLKLYGNQV